MRRCGWVPLGNELYVKYHDEEWDYKIKDFEVVGVRALGL